jgi:hypothetical protein
MQQATNADAAGRRETRRRKASPVQKRLSDLDKLIADLSKQCQCCNGQCNKPPKPGQKPGKPGAAGRGRTAARDSTDRLDERPPSQLTKAVNEMVKNLWGHLPEHNREQMLNRFPTNSCRSTSLRLNGTIVG